MSQWFNDIFLPSIFDVCSNTQSKWLSAKQTAICCKYMREHASAYIGDITGTIYRHKYYTCIWHGREVVLDYSKLNMCGKISFGPTAEEKEQNRIRDEKEKAEKIAEKIQFIKRKPERLERKIKGIQKKIDGLRACITDEIENPDEESPEYIALYNEQIDNLEKELHMYLEEYNKFLHNTQQLTST